MLAGVAVVLYVAVIGSLFWMPAMVPLKVGFPVRVSDPPVSEKFPA